MTVARKSELWRIDAFRFLDMTIIENIRSDFNRSLLANKNNVMEDVKTGMQRNQSVEERVREWLSENGYDYVVRTYQPGETVMEYAGTDKETISIPAVVEDADSFMKQFVKSFKEAHEITILKKEAEGVH